MFSTLFLQMFRNMNWKKYIYLLYELDLLLESF